MYGNLACLACPDSELQIALVALFSEMLYRFPNVVVAHVTRESVQQAISNGITAQQVLTYGLFLDLVFVFNVFIEVLNPARANFWTRGPQLP